MTKRQQMLLQEARKHIEPLKHIEFKCPLCGGIATVYRGEELRAECHACNARVKTYG